MFSKCFWMFTKIANASIDFLCWVWSGGVCLSFRRCIVSCPGDALKRRFSWFPDCIPKPQSAEISYFGSVQFSLAQTEKSAVCLSLRRCIASRPDVTLSMQVSWFPDWIPKVQKLEFRVEKPGKTAHRISMKWWWERLTSKRKTWETIEYSVL